MYVYAKVLNSSLIGYHVCLFLHVYKNDFEGSPDMLSSWSRDKWAGLIQFSLLLEGKNADGLLETTSLSPWGRRSAYILPSVLLETLTTLPCGTPMGMFLLLFFEWKKKQQKGILNVCAQWFERTVLVLWHASLINVKIYAIFMLTLTLLLNKLVKIESFLKKER